MAAGEPLTEKKLLKAFRSLDAALPAPVTLIVGGGTALMLAYHVPVRTTDVDAYPRTGSPDDLDRFVKEVARREALSSDWINPHFATFAHVLPKDYGNRLRDVFVGEKLRVSALGPEDLLVMKCFAGRAKDVGHARALLKLKPDLKLVEGRIQELIDRHVPGAEDAADFLDDLEG
jgi:uncharacterized nucleotidyltransferase DUF6036